LGLGKGGKSQASHDGGGNQRTHRNIPLHKSGWH
jgi:hypothetical protein